MRILVVSNLYPSASHPGFGAFVAARVRALRAEGADVRLVANRDPALHRRVARKYVRLAVNAGWFVFGSRLRREHIDVVEAHLAYPTGLIARPVASALGAPLVLFAHGADVREIPDRSPRQARLVSSTLDAACLVIANSRYLADEIGRRFPDVADRVRVLTPGIELDRFVLGSPDARVGVLFVGRLVRQKGADVLIEAAARLGPDARHLTLVGDGPERDELIALATDRRVELDVRGELDRVDTARAMASAAVVVVPSIYGESLGLVALEGMAAGAVVVASAVGGLRETVIDGKTGFSVPPGDPTVLANALERAMATAKDASAAAPIRAAGRAMAARHDVRRAALDSLAWYGTLCR